jgi:hypothetical protein
MGNFCKKLMPADQFIEKPPQKSTGQPEIPA